MAGCTNFTRFSVAEMVGLDAQGVELYAVVVKATYRWDSKGVALADVSLPVAEEDVHAGKPGESSVVLESDLVPVKPRVDVLLLGTIELPIKVPQIDATLEVGSRIRKTVRVFGDRLWMPGWVRTLAPSSPKPFDRMPIAWERSFGGMDPEHPKTCEMRNPFGAGMRHEAKSLEVKPVPNFEDPRRTVEGWRDRPRPVGFGPVGRFWQPRVRLAGTYDAKWQEERYPLLPLDFNPLFYNCAPEDQQLDRYLPGEEVRLTYMTRAGHERFQLPSLEVDVAFQDAREAPVQAVVRPDTIIIEPAERRFSLVGRARHYPQPNVLGLEQVVVGKPSKGWLAAQEGGKMYLDPRTLKPIGQT